MVSTTPVLFRRPGSFGAVRRLRALPGPALAAAAAVLALVSGGLTSFAQTVLPGAVASFANSSSGWTVLVVLIVALLRARPAWSAVLGVVGFTGLTAGYTIVSTLRGYPTSELFFLAAGVVVGPFVGVATAWLRELGLRPALAAALLGGIGLGEGVYGLTAVASSTSPVYWSAVVAAAVVLVAVVVARRTSEALQRVMAIGGVPAIAAAFVAAYSGALGLPL